MLNAAIFRTVVTARARMHNKYTARSTHRWEYVPSGIFQCGTKLAPQDDGHLVNPLPGTRIRRGLEGTQALPAVPFSCCDLSWQPAFQLPHLHPSPAGPSEMNRDSKSSARVPSSSQPLQATPTHSFPGISGGGSVSRSW